jgi:glycine reductase complex component B subunit gamma
MRVVHYINQFFAGMGGEEVADSAPMVKEGSLGPGRLLDRLLGENAEVVATVICGDSYFGENTDRATREVMELILAQRPELVVAGPAFNAGRYGLACGTVAVACEEQGIPAVTGMYPENPGLESVDRTKLYAVPTKPTGAGMGEALEAMVRIGLKRTGEEPLGLPGEEGYLPRGVRRNALCEQMAAERAIDQLLRKIRGEAYTTEIPLPSYDRVPPSVLSGALGDLELALVTEASVVPFGNPDRLESARGTRWLRYPLDGLDDLRAGEYMTVHGGFDNADVNEDPDRVLPLDVMRELAAEGMIGHLHDHYYVCTGMATAIQEAERIGREIAADLLKRSIHAVLVTST